jgi:predicted nicotinamide N-methyase
MGLCGVLASHLGAASVLLTDGDTDALAQLRRNVQANCSAYCDEDKDDNDRNNNNKGHNNSSHDVTCRQLVWGRNLDNFVSEHGVFDVILGSDIIYVEDIIEPLFETIERIMNPQADADATFILAYARRNVPIDLVLDHAKQRGFECTRPDESSAEGVFCFKRCATREG